MVNITPTAEQLAAREATLALGRGELLSINAYAGTGKTTAIGVIAEGIRSMRPLYLCYNAEMRKEAERRMPAHVTCKTSHQLAFKDYGRPYYKKLDNLRTIEVMRAIECFSGPKVRAAINTLNQYLCSDSMEMTLAHALDGCGREDGEILGIAKVIWRRMCDPADPLVMTHDGYLKLWALSGADIGGFDLILVDEAQDINPVTLQVVLRAAERGARVVFVGDTHQAIYGWRLAIDAMQIVSGMARTNLSLTESWRFPQPIADSASKLLSAMKGDKTKLVGRGVPKMGGTSSHCTLARSNAALVGAASDVVQQGQSVYFAATRPEKRYSPFDPYKFQQILDVYSLFSGSGKVITPFLNWFDGYNHLREFALGEKGDHSDADPDTYPLVSFVEHFGHDTPDMLKQIEASAVAPEATAHHFSTAHRAKGRDWDEVRILDGFIPLDDVHEESQWEAMRNDRKAIEEANLLYVAVTRARSHFDPPYLCRNFFGLPPKDAHLP